MNPLMGRLLLGSFVFFSFIFPISSPVLPSETLIDAVEILSDSGFVAMSLTLQLISQTLITQSSSATIFAPSDEAFKESGQPPLSLLQYHIAPLKFSIENLRSLPFGTKIPTFFPNHSLIVTTSASDGRISLNKVPINGSAIYDVGPLAVFGIDEFFDPSLQFSAALPPAPSPASEFNCLGDSFASGVDSIARALSPLKSRGYSVIASLLDLQLPVMREQMKLTVFAPVDEEMERHLGNLSERSSIFHAHVLPCLLTWSDLVKLEEGTTLWTLLEGFSIRVTSSGDVLVLNGVPIIFPDMYSSDSLVVHGLQQMLTTTEEEKLSADSFSEIPSNDVDSFLDYGEF